MKNLYFMRHGSAEWNAQSDELRDLSPIGRNEVKKIAYEVKVRNIQFDLIISSPANRARETAEIMKLNLGYSKDIIFKECFYFEDTKKVIDVIKDINNDINSVLMVGHNPTWTKIVSDLTESNRVYMDTASFASLKGDFLNWSETGNKEYELDYIISPKNLF